MKYSIRTLLLVLLAFAVLCAFYYRVFVLPLKADQPFATKVLENGLEIRLWAKPNFFTRPLSQTFRKHKPQQRLHYQKPAGRCSQKFAQRTINPFSLFAKWTSNSKA